MLVGVAGGAAVETDVYVGGTTGDVLGCGEEGGAEGEEEGAC